MALPWEHLLQADVVLPEIVEIVFIKKALTQPEPKVSQKNLFRIVVKPDATLMSDSVVLAVNMNAMEVEIPPAHGDLDG